MSATSSGRICEWQSAIGYAVVTFDHIAPSDATEIFAKLQWYDIRNTGFDWTRFPLHIRSARKLTLNETPCHSHRQGILGCRARAQRSIEP